MNNQIIRLHILIFSIIFVSESIVAKEPQKTLLTETLLYSGFNEAEDPYSLFDEPQQSANRSKNYNTYGIKGWYQETKYHSGNVRKAKYGKGVTVAVMDSRVRCNHRVLKGRCKGYAPAGTTSTFKKFGNHGTFVSGLIAGSKGYGVANKAKIVNYAMFDDKAQWVSGFLNNAMVHAKKQGASIANWSFGSSTGKLSSEIFNTLKIHRNSILVVKAAGNNRISLPSQTLWTYKYNLLNTDYRNLLIVGALGTDGESFAFYSNTPGTGCLTALYEACSKRNKWMYRFIVAPGNVTGAYAGSKSAKGDMRGTSMAAPLVAGTAALIKARWTKLTPMQIRNILLATATDLGPKGVDQFYGVGRLNIGKALSPVGGRLKNKKPSKLSSSKQRSRKTIALKGRVPFKGKYSTVSQSSAAIILDDFGRDFSAIDVVSSQYSPSRLNSYSFNVGNTSASLISDTVQNRITGYRFGGFSYINHYSYVDSDDSHEIVKDKQVALAILGPLFEGGEYVKLPFNNGYSLQVYNDRNTDNEGTSTGLVLSKEFNKKLTLSAGLTNELGRYGLTSIPELGLNGRHRAITAGMSHTMQSGSLSIDYNASLIYYPDNLQSEHLNSSGYGLASSALKLKYGNIPKLDEISFGVKKGGVPFGDFSSNLEGNFELNDLYHTATHFSAKAVKRLNARFSSIIGLDRTGSENRYSISLTSKVF